MSEMNVHTAGDEPDDGKFLSEDYGVGGPPAAAGDAPLQDSGKTPDILAAEIRTIKSQTGRMVLNASIEVGRRLTEAKAKLPHGSWGEYLKNEVDYSPSQAQNLMRVFREYGSDQQSLFGGEAKSQTFGRLTFSQALSLLVFPDEKRRPGTRPRKRPLPPRTRPGNSAGKPNGSGRSLPIRPRSTRLS